jgi:putative toxin-antitoxin system antitoxin component (TIGR02293 family)
MKDHPLYKSAVHVFKNEESAEKWLTKKIAALDNLSPIEYATTKEREKKVVSLLGRIERGVFS